MTSPPSMRPTREWPLLILALAIVFAVCIPLWQWSSGNAPAASGAARWTPERLGRLFLGPEQILCYAAFTWAAFILFNRYREVRRQRKAFGFELLPPGQCILVDDAWDLQRRIDDRTGKQPFLLANMLRLALSKFATSRSSRDVSEVVRTQADVDLARMVSSMSMVHYLAWAIPAIGFLGTVRGLAGSLTLDRNNLTESLASAAGHLNVAFDCTLVSLALSLMCMYILHAAQPEEENLVIDCQQYCLDPLVCRLYDLEPEAAHEPVVGARRAAP